VPDDVDAAFVGFWWSHVRLQDISRFLGGLHQRLESGARILIVDNRYVVGSSSRIERVDQSGNTYQRRTLGDGSVHEVLKNFPAPADVRRLLTDAGAADIEQTELPYYWYATYCVAGAPVHTPT
jgi:demethylmenaquinone methyltransferase/2-methoxy-6-polyprenyl-1,4-benzoquinol methylase